MYTVNNFMYAFSPVFIRNKFTKVFSDDIANMVKMSTEITEGE